MSTNNNVFLDKISAAYDELYKTQNLLADIIGSLEQCLKEGDDVNLTKDIGIYALQMPKFLKETPLMTGIRKICTGELAISDALKEADNYMYMLNEALDCFDDSALYRLSHENDDKPECSCSQECSEHECKCECEDGCEGGCGCSCECESDFDEDGDEIFQEEDFHLEISIKGSKNALSALFI